MNREQLNHTLHAASTLVDDPNILVIGSQSVLATSDEDELPDAATASMEIDLAFFDDPAEDKADAVDGAIGERCGVVEALCAALWVSVTRSVTKTPRDGAAPAVTDETLRLWRARRMVTRETDQAV